MSPGRLVNAQLTSANVFDFELVVLGTKIQIIVADDDDGFCLDRVKGGPEIILIKIIIRYILPNGCFVTRWVLNYIPELALSILQKKIRQQQKRTWLQSLKLSILTKNKSLVGLMKVSFL